MDVLGLWGLELPNIWDAINDESQFTAPLKKCLALLSTGTSPGLSAVTS